MSKIILGIDISKTSFDVALLLNNKFKTKKFDNTIKGFSELKQWLSKQEVHTAHACMEATGSYGEKLAQYLFDNQFNVSVVNPARIKGFAQSKLRRVKTDKTDSELIAQFCLAMNPDLWNPIPQYIKELRQWVSRLDALINMKLQENNRLESSEKEVSQHIKNHIDFLDKSIREVEQSIEEHIKKHKDLHDKSVLLSSIPGIGDKTIAVILAFFDNIEKFDSAKQITAFVGLNPKHRQSGSSVKGKSRISKIGDSSLRKAFYMPAIVAIKFNPIIKNFAERLINSGKTKMIVVIASMRKLLNIIYGVLKNKTKFNPNITLNNKILR
jgi:transposase